MAFLIPQVSCLRTKLFLMSVQHNVMVTLHAYVGSNDAAAPQLDSLWFRFAGVHSQDITFRCKFCPNISNPFEGFCTAKPACVRECRFSTCVQGCRITASACGPHMTAKG